MSDESRWFIANEGSEPVHVWCRHFHEVRAGFVRVHHERGYRGTEYVLPPFSVTLNNCSACYTPLSLSGAPSTCRYVARTDFALKQAELWSKRRYFQRTDGDSDDNVRRPDWDRPNREIEYFV